MTDDTTTLDQSTPEADITITPPPDAGAPADAGTAAEATDETFDPIDLDALNETIEYIRPALQSDGGDMVLLGADKGKVTIQLVGACGGCPMSTMTLTAGIERILRDRVPGVNEVVAV